MVARSQSIRWLAVAIVLLCGLYVSHVVYYFHYRHHLYTARTVPPNSDHRREMLLLSHHVYFAPGTGIVAAEMREVWHSQLHEMLVQDEEIEFALQTRHQSMDIGELIKYVLIVGEGMAQHIVRPALYADKLTVSQRDVLELARTGNYSSQERRSARAGGFQASKEYQSSFQLDVDPRHPPLLLFESFPSSPETLSFQTVYQYFDGLIAFIRTLRQVYPRCLLVFHPQWAVTQQLSSELRHLFDFLAWKHVVARMGVLLLLSPSAGEEVTAVQLLSQQLAVLHTHAQQYYRVHPSSSHDKELAVMLQESEIMRKLAEINAYLRPVLESEGQLTFFDTVSGHTTRGRGRHFSSLHLVNTSLHKACASILYTRKWDADCLPRPRQLLPLLVTGLGGTGSHFVSYELQRLGFDLPHEHIGTKGSVSWFYAVNDVLCNETYPYGALRQGHRHIFSPRFQKVLHVVRSPLQQIASFTAHSNKTYHFVYSAVSQHFHEQFEPEFLALFEHARQQQSLCWRGGACHLEFAALTWIAWNRIVRSYADATFRIDESDNLLNAACEHLWPVFNDLSTELSPKTTCLERRTTMLSGSFWARFSTWTQGLFIARTRKTAALHNRPHEQFNISSINTLHPLVLRELRAEALLYGFLL